NHGFFTGDDPVTWNNLNDPNAILIFPISSNMVLLGFNNKSVTETVFQEKNYKIVTQIRTVFAKRCLEIYYSKGYEWLTD
ncbi:hypothetical protein NL452_27410, partial [Klebsiella pneumoniae]|nr:hypothetical protein [Klebsiella pneumoniae]